MVDLAKQKQVLTRRILILAYADLSGADLLFADLVRNGFDMREILTARISTDAYLAKANLHVL